MTLVRILVDASVSRSWILVVIDGWWLKPFNTTAPGLSNDIYSWIPRLQLIIRGRNFTHLDWLWSGFKGAVSRDFVAFFYETNTPWPLINRLKYFRIRTRFRRDIRTQSENLHLSLVAFKGTIRRNPFRDEHIYEYHERKDLKYKILIYKDNLFVIEYLGEI